MAELTKVCVNGHEKIGENLYINSRGISECNKCRQESRERYAERKLTGAVRKLKEYCKNGHKYESSVTPRICTTCAAINSEKYRRISGAEPKGKASKCKRGHEFTEENTYITSNATRRCRECTRARDRARYHVRREKSKKYQLNWQRDNKHRTAAYRSSRRTRESKLDKVPIDLWLTLVKSFNGWCPYCRTPNNNLTLDHIVPISKGGNNSIENLIPACKSCNSSKRNTTLDVWLLRKTGATVNA